MKNLPTQKDWKKDLTIFYKMNPLNPLIQVRESNMEDLAFIYDAFQNAWAKFNELLFGIEQNKKAKDGRKVYLDAKNYFRGDAVKDAILTENMDALKTTSSPTSPPMALKVIITSSMTLSTHLNSKVMSLSPKSSRVFTWGILKTNSMRISRTMLQQQTP